ncbi:MAG: YhbY family RNA-binding protein [Candidatus Woesearchaeota archaeon]
MIESTTVQIGKNGVTENTLEEIIKQLRARKTVKIKILKSSLENAEREDTIKKIIKGTQSDLIFQRGNVVIIKEKRRAKFREQ